MATRPDSTILPSTEAEAIEAIPMGETLVLIQHDELGDANSLVIDDSLAKQLLPILQQMVGGR